MNILSVKGLHVGYTDTIVRNINFGLKSKEILAIVGESGSGKSTLLKSLIGKLPGMGTVSKGSIIYKERDIVKMNKKELREIRGVDVSMIFQSPGATLNPVRKIGSQFIETIRFHSDLTKKDAFEKAVSIMEKLNFQNPKQIMGNYPFQLSGGMKQRVSIAIALAMEPEILLADEPTSALDATVQKMVAQEMIKLRDQFGTAVIIVTHNISLSFYMADTIGVMYAGEMVEFGKKEEVVTNPLHPYTKALIESVPDIKGKKVIKGIEGKGIEFNKLPDGCFFADRCVKKKEICLKKHPEVRQAGKNHFYVCHMEDGEIKS